MSLNGYRMVWVLRVYSNGTSGELQITKTLASPMYSVYMLGTPTSVHPLYICEFPKYSLLLYTKFLKKLRSLV